MDNIEGITKYQTKKTDKKEKEKPFYDKVLKIMGLSSEEVKKNN